MSDYLSTKEEAVNAHVAAFSSSVSEPSWLIEQRKKAIRLFATTGFPSKYEDTWRLADTLLPYAATTLSVLDNERVVTENLDKATRVLIDQHRIAGTDLVLLIDSQLVTTDDAPSLPNGVRLSALETATESEFLQIITQREKQDGIAALNGAFWRGGLLLTLAPGTQLEHPLQILCLGITKSVALHTKLAIALGEGAKATIIESFVPAAKGWCNHETSFVLGPKADLTIVHSSGITKSSSTGVRNSMLMYRQHGRLLDVARFVSTTIQLGDGWTRHESTIDLVGKGAEALLTGAALLRERDCTTITTSVGHLVPKTKSHQIFKVVGEGRAHGVFQGGVEVKKGAAKTDAYQLVKALILDKHVRVDIKPVLEIYADDVKCGHGAAVSKIDENALFYLISRGIPSDLAQAILIKAFIMEALDPLTDEILHAAMTERIDAWFDSATTKPVEST